MLAELGAKPVPERVVEHGKIITAAGVSAGIDMGLRLVQIKYGDEAAQAVQLGIEYDPEPPVDAGSPEKAPQGDRRPRHGQPSRRRTRQQSHRQTQRPRRGSGRVRMQPPTSTRLAQRILRRISTRPTTAAAPHYASRCEAARRRL